MKKVYINPGHDIDYDSGAVGNGMREADVALSIGKKLASLLISKGISVKVLQSDNLFYDSSYKDREVSVVEDANSWDADIFVSIHCNAFSNPNARGTETLYFPGSSNGKNLASEIHGKILGRLPLIDRGIKERPDLIVLKRTDMPAVLVETAFITNYEDSELLRNRQDDFALVISEGILSFLGEDISKESSLVEGKSVSVNHYKIMDNENLAFYVAKTLLETGVEGGYDAITKSSQKDLPSIGCSQWLADRADSLLKKIPGGDRFAGKSYSYLSGNGLLEELASVISTPEGIEIQKKQLAEDCLAYVNAVQQVEYMDDTRCAIYAASWCTVSKIWVSGFLNQLKQSGVNIRSLKELANGFSGGFLDYCGLNNRYRQGYSNRAWNVYYYVAAIDLTTNYGIPVYGDGPFGR